MRELWFSVPFAVRFVLGLGTIFVLPVVLGILSTSHRRAWLWGGLVGFIVASVISGPDLVHTFRYGVPLDLSPLKPVDVYWLLSKPIIGLTVATGALSWLAHCVQVAVKKRSIRAL